jgi:hypothetical protein
VKSNAVRRQFASEQIQFAPDQNFSDAQGNPHSAWENAETRQRDNVERLNLGPVRRDPPLSARFRSAQLEETTIMTLALSSRTKLHMGLAIAILTVVGSATLSTPAFAAAKQSDVVAACKRTKGCTMFPGQNGGLGGCTPNVCFSCTKGKCVQTLTSEGGRSKYKPGAGDTIGKLLSPSHTKANDAIVHRGNTAPVKFAAPGNSHMRTGGRH